MTRIAVLAGCCVVIAGCQVSVFGSEMITVIGSDVGTGGTSARSCGEPDDARRAREDAETCSDRCRIEGGALTGECAVVLDELRAGVATLDLRGADGLIVRMEICDPSGAAFELSDATSPAASSHDATLRLDDTRLTVRASEGSGVEPSQVSSWIAATGCTTRTLVLAEQLVYLADSEHGLCGTGMLRVDPPSDAEGSPDSRWYLALGGSIDGSAQGSGVRSVDLCFW